MSKPPSTSTEASHCSCIPSLFLVVAERPFFRPPAQIFCGHKHTPHHVKQVKLCHVNTRVRQPTNSVPMSSCPRLRRPYFPGPRGSLARTRPARAPGGSSARPQRRQDVCGLRDVLLTTVQTAHRRLEYCGWGWALGPVIVIFMLLLAVRFTSRTCG